MKKKLLMIRLIWIPILFIIFIFPKFSFGQIFPEIPDFNGEIEQIVAKHYGMELRVFNIGTGIYLPRCFDWKYIYNFDDNGNLIKKVYKYRGKLRASYIYQYDSLENAFITREIDKDINNNNIENYSEDKIIYDQDGKIKKIEYWVFHSSDSTKELSSVAKDIKYDELGNVISFYYHGYDIKGNELIGKLYELKYDSFSRVISLEKKAIYEKTIVVEKSDNIWTHRNVTISKPELLKKTNYEYNKKGQVEHLSIKYFGDLYKYSTGYMK